MVNNISAQRATLIITLNILVFTDYQLYKYQIICIKQRKCVTSVVPFVLSSEKEQIIEIQSHARTLLKTKYKPGIVITINFHC